MTVTVSGSQKKKQVNRAERGVVGRGRVRSGGYKNQI